MIITKDRLSDVFLLMLALAGLFVPSVFVRGAMICVIGYLIYRHERRLALLVPASPGVVFWLGNFLSYVVSGIGTGLIFGNWGGYGMRYLEDAMFYIGLGLAFFLMGAWVAKSTAYAGRGLTTIVDDLVMNRHSITLLACFYLLPVIGAQILASGGFVTFYNNIVIGMIQSVKTIPIILLGIYMLRQNRNLLALLILIACALSIPFQGILMGYGRGQMMQIFVFGMIVWLSLGGWSHVKQRMTTKIGILVGMLFFTLLFGYQTLYRSYYGNDVIRLQMQKRDIVSVAFERMYKTDNLIKDTLGSIFIRVNELNSLELFGRAKDGIIASAGWTMNDLKQVLFSWIPKMVYSDKGHGGGREIMVLYGFGEGNIPVSLLGDVFRRSGVAGLMVVYFTIGVLSTLISAKLRKSWGAFGVILSYYLALLMFDMYARDAINCVTIFLYRLPSSAIMIYAIFRISGVLPVQSKRKSYFRRSTDLVNNRVLIE